MPIYVYETINEPRRRFEVRQSMKEAALEKEPGTGEPVRRVISGGYGVLRKGGEASGGTAGGGCGAGCGCHGG